MSPANIGLRITRLDSIRLLAAIWVVLSHEAIQWKALSDQPCAKFLLAAINASFSGVAAVMVFFIVSGLCIHLPQATGRPLLLTPFLLRRYCRIGLPLLAIGTAAELAGQRSAGALGSVTWSLYAELFYYALYPMLYWASQRIGWRVLISASLVISMGVATTHLGQTHIPPLGWLAWVWGLPIWMSGCLMAERLRAAHLPSVAAPLWAWRVVTWLASILTTYLVFHAPVKVSYSLSMLVFGAVAYSWLLRELQCQRPAWSLLERGGAVTYSLYLVHPIAVTETATIAVAFAFPPIVDSVLRCLSIVIATTMMYWLIEAPSHQLARGLASRLAMRSSSRHRGNMQAEQLSTSP
jgi:peptidoglycan/LPS O-acetylase OafA/YrhL